MSEQWTVGLNGDMLRIWVAKPNDIRSGVADICIHRNINDSGPSKTEQDRAHLIAAAPQLLEALKAARTVLDDGVGIEHALDLADAAIKAATEG